MGLLHREPERGKLLPFVMKRVRAFSTIAMESRDRELEPNKLSPCATKRVRAVLPLTSILKSEPETVDEFTRNECMTGISPQEVVFNLESAFSRQAKGWKWICSCLGCFPHHQDANGLDVTHEPKAADDFERNVYMTQATAQEVTSIPCRKVSTFESSFNRHATERKLTMSSSKFTCNDSQTRSCGSSWSSDDDDDDEESGESLQPSLSRVDKVLDLSAMADIVSDISNDDSDSGSVMD
ncbi:hypothetical protein ACHAXA_006961 [Cyclostephanos tholiformis]|uniref:Uncharacterized protein n=1 Tax=Cyclostephanos tholiformis TaxID=382380 RepID=A0ABD3RXD1_9STRA